jgi:hypothetical protein
MHSEFDELNDWPTFFSVFLFVCFRTFGHAMWACGLSYTIILILEKGTLKSRLLLAVNNVVYLFKK